MNGLMELPQIEQARKAAIDELIVTVNHHINNPLTTILTYAELLRLATESGVGEKTVKGLDKIIEAAQQIKNVTHQLARMDRAESVAYLDNVSMLALSED